MHGKIRLAVLFLIIANVIWGASFPIYKWSLENVPPFTFVFLRFFVGSLLLLPFCVTNLHIQKSDLKHLSIISFVGITLNICLLFFGLSLSSSINAPIVLSTGPIFLLVSSIIFLHEKPQKKIILGMTISLIGVLFLILRPVFENGISTSILGNLLLLLSTLASVTHTIFLRKIMPRYNPITITFWSFLIGSFPLVPFVLIELQTFSLIQDMTLQGLSGVLFGIVFASAIAHVMVSYGLKYIAANEVGIFSYVDPVATLIVAIPLLGEVITPAYIFSSLLIFAGIFIAENRLHWHPLHKLKS